MPAKGKGRKHPVTVRLTADEKVRLADEASRRFPPTDPDSEKRGLSKMVRFALEEHWAKAPKRTPQHYVGEMFFKYPVWVREQLLKIGDELLRAQKSTPGPSRKAGRTRRT